jgi:hypothetical protein
VDFVTLRGRARSLRGNRLIGAAPPVGSRRCNDRYGDHGENRLREEGQRKVRDVTCSNHHPGNGSDGNRELYRGDPRARSASRRMKPFAHALEANASIDRVMCGMPAAIDSGLAVVPRRLGLPLYSIALRSKGVAIASSIRARVVPRPARVRLSDFLATGRLGPVHCGLSRNQVAGMLGPPDGWIGKEFPAYWFYGKLELSFDPERPHAMHFFQIESAGGLSGDCEVIAGGKIVLELEGLSGDSHPADFLRMMSDGARPLHVIYSRPSNTGSFVLQIVSGSVTIIFDFEFPDEIVSDLAALDEAAYLRQCDRFARLDSIYAFRKPDGPVRSDTKFAVTAAAYLAAMT